MAISNKIKNKLQRKNRRHRRVRAKAVGTARMPRLCVFRSNQHIFAQLINDQKGTTLAVYSDLDMTGRKKEIRQKTGDSRKTVGKENELSQKRAAAFKVGQAIAKKASELKVKKIVFDRSGYRYHGRVKNLAEGARAGGLEF